MARLASLRRTLGSSNRTAVALGLPAVLGELLKSTLAPEAKPILDRSKEGGHRCVPTAVLLAQKVAVGTRTSSKYVS